MDALGNPEDYYNGAYYEFTWEGRRLASAVYNDQTFSFTYNDEGIRTGKTVDGVKHTYILEGSRIAAELWGANILVYIYDATGAPLGMQYRNTASTSANWETYWYDKNSQGDIVAVYSDAGVNLIEYTYDAWGNHTTTYWNGGGNTAAQYNPFRYRSYYFDEDLGLYYLNSRYYDQTIGRFISADTTDILTVTPMGLTDKNLFAYCNNNPISFTDNSGEFPWHIAIGALLGAVIGGISAAVGGGSTVDIVVGVVAGAVSGALTASGIGETGQIIGSALISMASNAVGQIEDIIADESGETTFNVGDMVFDGAVSAVCASFSRNGASHGNTAGINASWNQLFKKGAFNKNAQKYFFKTAHNSDHKFVLKSLAEGLGYNTIGSGVITAKNWLINALRW